MKKILIVCSVVLASLGCSHKCSINYSSSFIPSNLFKIEVGMLKAQVNDLLGKPVSKFGPSTYVYTWEMQGCNYPMVSIQFDSNNLVSLVYVKEYRLFNDQVVYSIDQNNVKIDLSESQKKEILKLF